MCAPTARSSVIARVRVSACWAVSFSSALTSSAARVISPNVTGCFPPISSLRWPLAPASLLRRSRWADSGLWAGSSQYFGLAPRSLPGGGGGLVTARVGAVLGGGGRCHAPILFHFIAHMQCMIGNEILK